MGFFEELKAKVLAIPKGSWQIEFPEGEFPQPTRFSTRSVEVRSERIPYGASYDATGYGYSAPGFETHYTLYLEGEPFGVGEDCGTNQRVDAGKLAGGMIYNALCDLFKPEIESRQKEYLRAAELNGARIREQERATAQARDRVILEKIPGEHVESYVTEPNAKRGGCAVLIFLLSIGTILLCWSLIWR